MKVKLRGMSKLHLGIDIGGTFIKGVLIDNRKVLYKTTRETNDTDENWQNAVTSIFEELTRQAGSGVAGVGLSAPGLTDGYNRKVVCMPGRLAGLEQLDWSDFLGQQVDVLNDAHAALISESKWGIARNVSNVAMLTLGTGVGGGLLIKGELVQGYLQRSGHFGHISIDSTVDSQDNTGISGSLEDAVGEATLNHRSLGKFNKTQELVNAYRSGDHWASYLWLSSLRKLALGIVSICNAISPEIVVLAGGITAADEDLTGPLSTFMDLYEWRPAGQATPVKLAKFQEFAGAIGAALFAQSQNKK